MTLANLYSENRGKVDILRLMLAVCVVFSHFFTIFDIPCEPAVRDFQGNSMNLGYFAVRAFFGISGFVIMLSAIRNPDAKRFLLARVRRIFPGYAFFLLAAVFLIIPMILVRLSSSQSNFTEIAVSIGRFVVIGLTLPIAAPIGINGLNSSLQLDGLTGLPLNASLWTLPLEIKAYLAIWIFLFFRLRLRGLWVIYAICLLFVVMPHISLPIIEILIPDFTLILTFLGGAIVAERFGDVELKRRSFSIFLVSLALCFLSLSQIWIANLFFGVGVSIFVPILFQMFGKKDFRVPMDLSYGTYLWGWPVCLTFYAYFPTTPVVLSFLVCLALTLATSAVSWVFVEKRFLT